METKKIKADNKFEYGDCDPCDYTNFEFLQEKVDVLTDELILISKILKQNNLVYKQESSPETDDCNLEDNVFKRLENKE